MIENNPGIFLGLIVSLEVFIVVIATMYGEYVISSETNVKEKIITLEAEAKTEKEIRESYNSEMLYYQRVIDTLIGGKKEDEDDE